MEVEELVEGVNDFEGLENSLGSSGDDKGKSKMDNTLNKVDKQGKAVIKTLRECFGDLEGEKRAGGTVESPKTPCGESLKKLIDGLDELSESVLMNFKIISLYSKLPFQKLQTGLLSFLYLIFLGKDKLPKGFKGIMVGVLSLMVVAPVKLIKIIFDKLQAGALSLSGLFKGALKFFSSTVNSVAKGLGRELGLPPNWVGRGAKQILRSARKRSRAARNITRMKTLDSSRKSLKKKYAVYVRRQHEYNKRKGEEYATELYNALEEIINKLNNDSFKLNDDNDKLNGINEIEDLLSESIYFKDFIKNLRKIKENGLHNYVEEAWVRKDLTFKFLKKMTTSNVRCLQRDKNKIINLLLPLRDENGLSTTPQSEQVVLGTRGGEEDYPIGPGFLRGNNIKSNKEWFTSWKYIDRSKSELKKFKDDEGKGKDIKYRELLWPYYGRETDDKIKTRPLQINKMNKYIDGESSEPGEEEDGDIKYYIFNPSHPTSDDSEDRSMSKMKLLDLKKDNYDRSEEIARDPTPENQWELYYKLRNYTIKHIVNHILEMGEDGSGDWERFALPNLQDEDTLTYACPLGGEGGGENMNYFILYKMIKSALKNNSEKQEEDRIIKGDDLKYEWGPKYDPLMEKIEDKNQKELIQIFKNVIGDGFDIVPIKGKGVNKGKDFRYKGNDEWDKGAICDKGLLTEIVNKEDPQGGGAGGEEEKVGIEGVLENIDMTLEKELIQIDQMEMECRGKIIYRYNKKGDPFIINEDRDKDKFRNAATDGGELKFLNDKLIILMGKSEDNEKIPKSYYNMPNLFKIVKEVWVNLMGEGKAEFVEGEHYETILDNEEGQGREADGYWLPGLSNSQANQSETTRPEQKNAITETILTSKLKEPPEGIKKGDWVNHVWGLLKLYTQNSEKVMRNRNTSTSCLFKCKIGRSNARNEHASKYIVLFSQTLAQFSDLLENLERLLRVVKNKCSDEADFEKISKCLATLQKYIDNLNILKGLINEYIINMSGIINKMKRYMGLSGGKKKLGKLAKWIALKIPGANFIDNLLKLKEYGVSIDYQFLINFYSGNPMWSLKNLRLITTTKKKLEDGERDTVRTSDIVTLTYLMIMFRNSLIGTSVKGEKLKKGENKSKQRNIEKGRIETILKTMYGFRSNKAYLPDKPLEDIKDRDVHLQSIYEPEPDVDEPTPEDDKRGRLYPFLRDGIFQDIEDEKFIALYLCILFSFMDEQINITDYGNTIRNKEDDPGVRLLRKVEDRFIQDSSSNRDTNLTDNLKKLLNFDIINGEDSHRISIDSKIDDHKDILNKIIKHHNLEINLGNKEEYSIVEKIIQYIRWCYFTPYSGLNEGEGGVDEYRNWTGVELSGKEVKKITGIKQLYNTDNDIILRSKLKEKIVPFSDEDQYPELKIFIVPYVRAFEIYKEQESSNTLYKYYDLDKLLNKIAKEIEEGSNHFNKKEEKSDFLIMEADKPVVESGPGRLSKAKTSLKGRLFFRGGGDIRTANKLRGGRNKKTLTKRNKNKLIKRNQKTLIKRKNRKRERTLKKYR